MADDHDTRHLAEDHRHLDTAGCLWDGDAAELTRDDIRRLERQQRDEQARQ